MTWERSDRCSSSAPAALRRCRPRRRELPHERVPPAPCSGSSSRSSTRWSPPCAGTPRPSSPASGTPDLRLRQQPDPAGDMGYAVFLETAGRAQRDRWIAALRERKVPASAMSGSVLLPAEESVIAKRARHPDWPAFNSPAGRAIRYRRSARRPSACSIASSRFASVRSTPPASTNTSPAPCGRCRRSA